MCMGNASVGRTLKMSVVVARRMWPMAWLIASLLPLAFHSHTCNANFFNTKCGLYPMAVMVWRLCFVPLVAGACCLLWKKPPFDSDKRS